MIKVGHRYDKEYPEDWPWVYFHCNAERFVDEVYNKGKSSEEWGPPDLVGSTTPLDEVHDGIHEVSLYGSQAHLYLWTSVDEWKVKWRKGLITFPEDAVAEAHAKKLFDKCAGWV